MLPSLLILFSAASATTPKVLWTDPGKVEAIDFTVGAGGPQTAPNPPFTFIREDEGGTSPKVIVKDARGVEWRVKGGLEVRAETFVTRLVSALGYYAETTYFLASGRIEAVGTLKRAHGFLKPDGTFTYASFERRDPRARFLTDQSWSWNDSPFAGSREIKGLKILMMLVSNWDNKDRRDTYRGSNTGILQITEGDRTQDVYFVTDWGQTLGGWGRFFGRSMWNCAHYSQQTHSFVTGVDRSIVQFGYAGQHTDDFRAGITVEDVRWLMNYLGRITDAQIRAGLLSSGATPEEERCFTQALRARIEQLRKISA